MRAAFEMGWKDIRIAPLPFGLVTPGKLLKPSGLSFPLSLPASLHRYMVNWLQLIHCKLSINGVWFVVFAIMLGDDTRMIPPYPKDPKHHINIT